MYLSILRKVELIYKIGRFLLHTSVHALLNKYSQMYIGYMNSNILHSLRSAAPAAAVAGRRRRRWPRARTTHAAVHAARSIGRQQLARIRRLPAAGGSVAQHLGGAALDACPRSVDGAAVTGSRRRRWQLVQTARADHHSGAVGRSDTSRMDSMVCCSCSHTLLHHRCHHMSNSSAKHAVHFPLFKWQLHNSAEHAINLEMWMCACVSDARERV